MTLWRPCCRGCCRAQRVSGGAAAHMLLVWLRVVSQGGRACAQLPAMPCMPAGVPVRIADRPLLPAATAAAMVAAGNWETDSSEALAQDLLSRAQAKADAEYLAALSGDFSEDEGAADDDEDAVGPRRRAAAGLRGSSDEDDEDDDVEGSGVEDDEEEGAAAARSAG